MQRQERRRTSLSDNPPGQPLASKMQSPFHQRSRHGLSSSLFYSCLPFFWFCFRSSISHFHSVFITCLPLWALLTFPWLRRMGETAIHTSLNVLMNVDFSEEYSLGMKGFVQVWLPQMCTYVNHLMATY